MPCAGAAHGELQNALVALISRKSISARRSRLSKENNGDESQEAIREREVLLLCLPFVRRSRVPGKRGRQSQVTRPGWSSSSALLGCVLTDGNPGSKAVVNSLVEIMAHSPSQMKGKVCKSCSPGDGIVGALHKAPNWYGNAVMSTPALQAICSFLCCHPCLPG